MTTNSINISSTENAASESVARFSNEDDDNEGQVEMLNEEDLLDDEQAEQDAHFEAVSKAYIVDETRVGYSSSNRNFLLWLDQKHPECISDNAKTTLQTTFEAQTSTTEKHKDKRVYNKALQLITGAKDEMASPILFLQSNGEDVCRFHPLSRERV